MRKSYFFSSLLGRVVVENREVQGLTRDSILALEKAVAESPELYRGKINWHQQFWAHEFTDANKGTQPEVGDR